MDYTLNEVIKEVYNKCSLRISGYTVDPESKEYEACGFKINGSAIISRSAKITPKKKGQFVTFWKRSGGGSIEPFDHHDPIDFYVVNVRGENKLGLFIFPKSILIKKGIISTDKKEGKRAFRVYPPWDIVESKQAELTQNWQLNYFCEIGISTDFKRLNDLYHVD